MPKLSEQPLLEIRDSAWSAVFSDDRRYRYRLIRTWGRGHILPWIMLNPSIADASTDDNTIRRCRGFARDFGYAGLAVWNLYAYISTDPGGLWLADDPIGPDNDRRLRNLFAWAAATDTPVIAAWGTNAQPERVTAVLAMPGARDVLHCLATTKSGAPHHPLRLPASARPTRWEPAA